jgi:molybdate transport system ATP-binding protein
MDTLGLAVATPLRGHDLELSLEVGAEPVAVVGPSGAGKTTLLRVVAGLTRPATGHVRLGGETWLDTERGIDRRPEERRAGFVFQDYALFPHLTVERNVAFGGRRRVSELLERFGIGHLGGARPHELSGGERQRVALARALAREPAVLLLDEPLAALDPHTRDGVRGELQTLLRDLGLPTLLVTHDFADAAALADRVGVLLDGHLVQLAPAAELAAEPAHAFVAALTGGNLLPGRVTGSRDGLAEISLDAGGVVFSTEGRAGRVGVVVDPVDVAVAREQPDDSALNHVRGTISALVPRGNRVTVRVGPLRAEVTRASAERLALRPGDDVVASFKATGTRLVPLR